MRRTPAAEALVVNFHGLGEPDDGIPNDERAYWCPVSVYRDLLDSLVEVTQRTGVPIQLTFDDGNMTDVTLGLPELVERGLTAAFFICAGRLGRDGYLDDPSVRHLLDSGMEVGSHGWGHVDWRTADDATLDQEIDSAHRVLSDLAGKELESVAVPFGRYDRRVLQRLYQRGYSTIYTSDGGRARIGDRLVTREAYLTSWTDRTLEDFSSTRLSSKAELRRAVGKRWRRLR